MREAIPGSTPIAHHIDLDRDGRVHVNGGGIKGKIAELVGGGGVSWSATRDHDAAHKVYEAWKKTEKRVYDDPDAGLTEKMLADRDVREAKNRLRSTDKALPVIFQAHQGNR
ncbi:TPA: hypothetical protein DIV55_06700 [Patescibacteria group bacterium]|nr:hypothetical protein [Patescibacteria group bacterium]